MPEELQDLNTGIGELDKRIKREEEKKPRSRRHGPGLTLRTNPERRYKSLKRHASNCLRTRSILSSRISTNPSLTSSPTFQSRSESMSRRRERQKTAAFSMIKMGIGYGRMSRKSLRNPTFMAEDVSHGEVSGNSEKWWKKILHDVTSAVTGTVKSMFTGSRNNENGDIQSFTE